MVWAVIKMMDAVDSDREIETIPILEVWELWSRFYIPKGSSTHRRMDWR